MKVENSKFQQLNLRKEKIAMKTLKWEKEEIIKRANQKNFALKYSQPKREKIFSPSVIGYSATHMKNWNERMEVSSVSLPIFPRSHQNHI